MAIRPWWDPVHPRPLICDIANKEIMDHAMADWLKQRPGHRMKRDMALHVNVEKGWGEVGCHPRANYHGMKGRRHKGLMEELYGPMGLLWKQINEDGPGQEDKTYTTSKV